MLRNVLQEIEAGVWGCLTQIQYKVETWPVARTCFRHSGDSKALGWQSDYGGGAKDYLSCSAWSANCGSIPDQIRKHQI